MISMEVSEIEFDEAIRFASEKKTALVWIGVEPKEYIEEILGMEKNTLKYLDPAKTMQLGEEEAKKFDNHIFVCYHGNSSRYVANFLKDKYKIEALSLKGGVTRIVGEIF